MARPPRVDHVVFEVIAALKAGEAVTDVARKHGFTSSFISGVAAGRNWRHATGGVQIADTNRGWETRRKNGNDRVRPRKKKAPNKDRFVAKAVKKHGPKYDYTASDYVNLLTPIRITCLSCQAAFIQRPASHLAGHGCRRCAENRSRVTQDEFMARALAAGMGEQYDLSEAVFTACAEKVPVTCRACGTRKMVLANNLMRGVGCQACGPLKLTQDEFLERAHQVHGDKYDYNQSEYVDYGKPLQIGCRSHGPFQQSPSNHLNGRGCPRCNRNGVSKVATKWLDALAVPFREHWIVTEDLRVRVDGYDPETNTVYEFLGSYWHGDPAVFPMDEMNKTVGAKYQDLHAQTMRRLGDLRLAGYRVVYVWESDYRAESVKPGNGGVHTDYPASQVSIARSAETIR